MAHTGADTVLIVGGEQLDNSDVYEMQYMYVCKRCLFVLYLLPQIWSFVYIIIYITT